MFALSFTTCWKLGHSRLTLWYLISIIQLKYIHTLTNKYTHRDRGVHGVMVIAVGNRHGKADCISHRTSTIWTDMNPIIQPPSMNK